MTPTASSVTAFISHLSGGDVVGLVVSVILVAYLFYALVRGENL